MHMYAYICIYNIKLIDYLFSHQQLVNGTQIATHLAFRGAMGGILGEGPQVSKIDVSEVFWNVLKKDIL